MLIAMLASGVGNNPDPVPPVERVNGTSWNNGRRCGVADGFHFSKHLVEAQRDVTNNVFRQYPTGSCNLNNPAHRWPEVAVIIRAFSLPGTTKRLARVSAGNKVNSSIVFRVERFHVIVNWDFGEVFRQHLFCVRVDLTESDRFDSSDHLSRKRESSDPTEQIKMHNKTLHGTARSAVLAIESL
jgi:hypothetical protein